MNAVIYARYSSDSQREESIEDQLRECREYAERNGMTVVETYIDRALCAGGLPQLQAAVGIVAVKAIVQHVDDLVPVDGQQLLPGGDPGPLRRTVPVHGGDDGAHVLFLFTSGGIIPQFIQTVIPKFCRFCKHDSEFLGKGM